MTEISREEFLAHMGHLSEGLAGVNRRLDTLNGQTRKHGEEIAVLKDRSDEAKHAARKVGSVWGAAAGTIVAALVTVYKLLAGHP